MIKTSIDVKKNKHQMGESKKPTYHPTLTGSRMHRIYVYRGFGVYP